MKEDLYWLVNNHQGKAVDKWQSYLRCYETLFSPLRDERIALLELGVQNGGSLEVWGRFFPRAAVIVGCDSDSLCGELSFDDPRIKVVVGDSAAPSTLAAIAEISPEYDLIIDDAAHTSGNIIANFASFFPCVRPGGVYVVEDLHCSYWRRYEGGLYNPDSAISFFKALVDVLNQEHVEAGDRRGLNLYQRKTERHGIQVPEGLADSAVSIEFRNSMAIIRKGEGNERLLGHRLIRGETATVEPQIFAKAQGRGETKAPELNAVNTQARSQLWSNDPKQQESHLAALQVQLSERLKFLLDELADEYDVPDNGVAKIFVDAISDSRSFNSVAAQLGSDLYGRLAASLALTPANSISPEETIKKAFAQLNSEMVDVRQGMQECLSQKQSLMAYCSDQEQKIGSLGEKVDRLNAQLHAAQRDKQRVLESRSWRYTASARYLFAKLQSLVRR